MNRSLPSPGGNPARDNARRLRDRRLDRVVKGAFHVATPRGRGRKKFLTNTGRTEYKNLILAVARELKARSK